MLVLSRHVNEGITVTDADARLGVPIGGCSEKMFSQLMFTVLADIWAIRRRVI